MLSSRLPFNRPPFLGGSRPQPVLGFDFVQSPSLVAGRGGQTITFTRASDGTRFNSSGTLVTETTNVARFDYNPSTLAALGLLIEESRTNLCLQSEVLDNASWTKSSGTSITANAIAAKNGNTTADKIIESDTTNVIRQVFQASFSFVSGTTYTLSWFAKSAERTSMWAGFNVTAFPATTSAQFNLSAVTAVPDSGNATATITDVGSGWYKCTMTATANTTISSAFEFRMNSLAVYVGVVNNGMYVWGVQLEAGAFATSYIATTTIAVNRAVDVATIATITPWYNQAEGTLFAEADVFATTTDTTTRVVFGFGDPAIAFGSAEAVYMARSASSASVAENILDGGVSQGTTSGGNVTANVMFKIAMVYKLNDIAITVNGAVPATDLTATIPTVTTASIGSATGLWVSGGNHLNGHIKRLNYYNRSLKTQLQQLTA